MTYWIIKARPDRNDFRKFPFRDAPGLWFSSRIPPAVSRGDTLFLWAGSPTLRVIGQARLEEPDAGFDDNRRVHYFRVKYLTNLIDGPTIKELRRDAIVRTASFLKSGPAGTFFPLTQQQGSRMLQFLAARQQLPVGERRVNLELEEAEMDAVHRLGAGFGDPKTNRRVERAGVRAATHHYRADGWNVQSVEAQRIGYDLRCQNGRRELHVEVKAIKGRGQGFILTFREYERATADAHFELCLVESALTAPGITTFAGGEILRVFNFTPLAYKATRAGRTR